MESIKCVIVGDGAVGKTSMLSSYTTNNYSENYIPTVFETFNHNHIFNGKKVKLELWDTAGQEAYDRLRPLSYKHVEVFLICFSVVDLVSFKNVKTKWYPEVKHFSPTSKIILVGTKLDLCGNEFKECNGKPVDFKDVIVLKKKIGAYGYYECSAVTQMGLVEVFDGVVESVLYGKKNKRICSIL